MILKDVFWIVKGFHVIRLWISQANLHVRHKTNQVLDTIHSPLFMTSMVPRSVDHRKSQFNSSSVQTKKFAYSGR